METFRRYMKKEPDLPKIFGQEFLIDYLFRLGISAQTGMGMINISYQEIAAWANIAKIPISGWQAETLFKLSQAYVGQFVSAKDKACKAPWSPQKTNVKSASENLGNGILKAFESLAAKKPAKSKRRQNPSQESKPRRGKDSTL